MSRTGITKTEAHKELEALKNAPFDLTADGALSKDRFHKYKTSTSGLEYHYATQRVDDSVLNALQKLADETSAVDQYKEMLSGETLNKIEGFESEDRQVLHTAVRNVFADLNDAENIGSSVDAIRSAQTELDKLSKEIDEFDYYEPKLRIEYFGNDISRQNGIQAVKDFNYKTIYTDK